MDSEIQILDRQSRNVILYLTVVATLAFFLGYYLLGITDRMVFVIAVALPPASVQSWVPANPRYALPAGTTGLG